MSAEDASREELIKKSREVLKCAKAAIYALHRRDVKGATALVASARSITMADLLPIVTANPTLRFGAFSAAMEEYAEAAIFAAFLATGAIPTLASLEFCTKEEYLGGVMDFTGELNRYAVLRATERDMAGVQSCRNVLDALFSQLSMFDWRNGQLRRKFDAVKYTLKKLEQIIYELTLSQAGVPVVPKGGVEEGDPNAEGGGAEGGEGGAEEGAGAVAGGGGGGPANKRPRK